MLTTCFNGKAYNYEINTVVSIRLQSDLSALECYVLRLSAIKVCQIRLGQICHWYRGFAMSAVCGMILPPTQRVGSKTKGRPLLLIFQSEQVTFHIYWS